MSDLDTAALPRPFCGERFTCLREGIFDHPETAVWLNESRDFACLEPRRKTDYIAYQPRVARLGLQTYKRKENVGEWRYRKLRRIFGEARSVVEIGAGDGAFLATVRQRHPSLSYACIEPDHRTKPLRDEFEWLTQYDGFADAPGGSFDLVCLFHVLEHIIEPAQFLESCTALLAPGGRIVIEVPSLEDPLLSLYHVDAYQNFFFQTQHPYSYSAASLGRLLDAHGLAVDESMAHQRYGLENHLAWLRDGKPGGDETYKAVFSDVDDGYRECLERGEHADAVLTVASPKSPK